MSRKPTTTAKTTASTGMKWRWFAAVHDAVDAEALTPTEARHVLLVAFERGCYASSDGTLCYPAKETIARRARVKRDVVTEVDQWLVDHNLMATNGRTNQGGAKVYQLVLPRQVAPTRGQVLETKMPPDGGNLKDEVAPEVAPEDAPVEGHNQYTTSRSEVVVGSVPPPSSPGAALPLSEEQRSTARRFLAVVVRDRTKPYREIDTEMPGLLDAAHRLIAGGWTPLLVGSRVVDLPPKPTSSAAGVVRTRLESLPDSPDEDDASRVHPVRWAEAITTALLDNDERCGIDFARLEERWPNDEDFRDEEIMREVVRPNDGRDDDVTAEIVAVFNGMSDRYGGAADLAVILVRAHPSAELLKHKYEQLPEFAERALATAISRGRPRYE